MYCLKRGIILLLLAFFPGISINAQQLSNLVTIQSGMKTKRVSSYSKMMGNDIIIKLYWDGNDELSILAPIGPFFRQGWRKKFTQKVCDYRKRKGNTNL